MRIVLALDGIPLFDSGEQNHAAGAVKALAAAWCGLSDDEQAQFFEEVGRITEAWPNGDGDRQSWFIGRHMRRCQCISDAGRTFLRSIVSGMDYRDEPALGVSAPAVA